MNDSKAMSYEILVRRAYNCGRYGRKGADADIYRSLEYLEHHSSSNSKYVKDYSKQLELVKKYLSDSITEAMKQKSDLLFRTEMQVALRNVNAATDRSELDPIIELTLDTFVKNKIGWSD